MDRPLDVYLYGLTILSTIHRLNGQFPELDTYQEIRESFQIPGGETGNAAILLSKLGLKVRSEGAHLGTKTRDALLAFNKKFDVDSTGMHYDPDFEGWEDLVLVDDLHRTVFGWYQKRFSDEGGRKWTHPDGTAIRDARIVSIDPFFREQSERAAQLCADAGKKYVTIDCKPDSICHQLSAVNIVSREFIKREYRQVDTATLMERYRKNSTGLVIFTFGPEDLLYARAKGTVHRFTPFKVKVEGTLGAGDSFRAGILYGLLQGWEDHEIVKFAAAEAACVCRRFPLAQYPPSLEEVKQLMSEFKIEKPIGQV